MALWAVAAKTELVRSNGKNSQGSATPVKELVSKSPAVDRLLGAGPQRCDPHVLGLRQRSGRPPQAEPRRTKVASFQGILGQAVCRGKARQGIGRDATSVIATVIPASPKFATREVCDAALSRPRGTRVSFTTRDAAATVIKRHLE